MSTAQTRVQKQRLVTAAADSMDVAAIFSMFLHDLTRQFLQQMGKYFLFGGAGIISLALPMLSWREYAISKKPNILLRSIVETIVGLGIATAVVGTLFWKSLFAIAGPAIFASALGAKALLYHLPSAIFYAGVASVATDPASRKTAIDQVKQHSVATIAGALVTSAVIGVMLLGKTVMAVCGIASGIIGTGFAIKKAVQLFKSKKESQPLLSNQDFSDEIEAEQSREINTNNIVPTPPLPSPKNTTSTNAMMHKTFNTNGQANLNPEDQEITVDRAFAAKKNNNRHRVSFNDLLDAPSRYVSPVNETYGMNPDEDFGYSSNLNKGYSSS